MVNAYFGAEAMGQRPRIVTVVQTRSFARRGQLVSLKQVVDYRAKGEPAISARDAGKKGKERFVDLGTIRFLRHDHIGQQFDDRDKHSDFDYPTPGTAGTQRSQEHAGSEHE